MSECLQIILTALATVFVFVAGEIVQRLFIEPIQEQRRIIGRVCHAAIYYRGVTKDVAGEKPSEDAIASAQSTIRTLAADLRATLAVLPFYPAFATMRFALPRRTILRVSLQLERWALFMSQHAMQSAVAEITKLLDLDIEDEGTEFQQMMIDKAISTETASPNN